MSKYIIGSGWWCSGLNHSNAKGDDSIRQESFHDKWMSSIFDNCKPEKIFIIDSNSPIKPLSKWQDNNIEYISLNINANHSSNLLSGYKYCGWTSSVLLGLQYAELCDCEYFVYVEQDVLLHGKGIIEKVISEMKSKSKKAIFGSPGATPQPLQQSFFVIKKDFISRFLHRYKKIRYDDSIIGPEYKFAIASSSFYSLIPQFLFKYKTFKYMFRKLCHFNYFSIGYGRERPLNMNDSFFYFQHGSKEELLEYERKNLS